jgi:hypothetical protein
MTPDDDHDRAFFSLRVHLLEAAERRRKATRERPAPGGAYLSAAQVAALLNCSYASALRVMRAAGCLKLKGLVRIREGALQMYLEAATCPAPENPHASTAAQVGTGGTPISTRSTGISRSAPPTKRRPKPNSPGGSSLSESLHWLKARRSRK